MTLRYDTVTFMSDYGLGDEFVGIVHSVIRSISPEVAVIDLTHDIRPYDVRAGGLALARSAPYLCPGVVLAVVDPGVGSERKAIAVQVGAGSSVLIGPDNGLLAPAVAMCGGADRAVELDNEDYQLEATGTTFAGRDIFAPAAAHLCNGADLYELGTSIDPALLRPGLLPLSRPEEGAVVAEVLWVDRYGNAQLNIDPSDIETLGDRVRIVFNDTFRTVKVADHFSQIGVGEIGLVVDSYGLMAVVVDQGSAATQLGMQPGTEVRVEEITGLQDVPDAPVSTPVSLTGRDEDRPESGGAGT